MGKNDNKEVIPLEKPNLGHRSRVKKEFLAAGLDHFPPHKQLELLLYYAIPQGDVNTLSHQLIDHFGSISGVFDASIEELQKIKGVGEHTAILLKLIPALSRAYLEDSYSDGNILNDTQKVCNFLIPKFTGRIVESFFLLCLDGKKKQIYCDLLLEGTIDSVPIFVRTIVEIALRVGATYVILAHNHPDTFAIPSSEDLRTTKVIQNALATVSIKLIDHVIVARGDAVSMADSGYFLD